MSSTDLDPWDLVTDPNNPQPNIWPECSQEGCGQAYVWQQFLSLTTGGYKWAWARACKHKRAEAVLMTNDGPYQAPVTTTEEPG